MRNGSIWRARPLQALRQPGVLPRLAQGLVQETHQRPGVFLVLLGGGALGRGEEERSLLPAVVEQQGRIHFAAGLAAVGQAKRCSAPARTCSSKVGARRGVHDQPYLGGKGLATMRTGQLGGLRIRGIHGRSPCGRRNDGDE